jgi:hypothetical protein
VSLFLPVIVVPAATLIGFGAYAFAASAVAPLTIETAAGIDELGGVDGAEGDGEDEPHAAVRPSSRVARTTRNVM